MSEKLIDYRQLNVWQKAHKLSLDVYEITKKFPKDERLDMVMKIRQFAADIPIQIARGFMRRNPQDKTNYYNGTLESLEALKYYIILSNELNYSKQDDELFNAMEEVGRMLTGLVKSVRSDPDRTGRESL